jgi:ferredoxin
MVRLMIDQNACQGHGRCYATAPQLIGADDQGYPVVPADGVEVDDLALAEEIEGGCPEMAISLSD